MDATLFPIFMPQRATQPQVTERDLEILAALDKSPLTSRQLLKLSITFSRPFTDERRVRERLQVLTESDRVRRWPYATAGRGSPNYYLLSPVGYQLLHGKLSPPTKRAFSEIGIARHHHSHALAEFIVHTEVAAHVGKAKISGFYPENRLRLQVNGEYLYPDCAFQLITSHGKEFSYFVELDNSTERIRSMKQVESWQRKIRLYDALQDQSLNRFRVLVIPTKSTERLAHILNVAKETMQNPDRSLFLGSTLSNFLAQQDAITGQHFLDHRRRIISMLPPTQKRQKKRQAAQQQFMEIAAVGC